MVGGSGEEGFGAWESCSVYEDRHPTISTEYTKKKRVSPFFQKRRELFGLSKF
jgi:hypothetical protein